MAKTTKRTSKKPVKRASKPKKRVSKKASSKRTSRKPVKRVSKRFAGEAASPAFLAAQQERVAKRLPAKTTVDFDDEDSVREEMARALDVSPEDLKIEEFTHSFTAKMYQVELKGVNGPSGKESREYYVVQDDDAAEEEALARVTQDLEQEPELFSKDFIESHIDEDRLRRDLTSDVENMAREEADEMSDAEFWKAASNYGIDEPDEDDDETTHEPTDEAKEQYAEKAAEDRLKDPMQYLEDIYGKEDAVKRAIQIAGIDVKAAAQEAVNTDGAGHFLGGYDLQTHESPNGLVYWRQN